MEYITEWARQIAGYLIFSSVLVNLIRRQSYIKYVRLVLGIILIVLICKPVLHLLLRSGELEIHLSRYLEADSTEDEMFLRQINGVRDKMVAAGLEAKVEERIKSMAEAAGFEVKDISFVFNTTEAYPKPEQVSLVLGANEGDTGQFAFDSPVLIRLREQIVAEFACDKQNVRITLQE